MKERIAKKLSTAARSLVNMILGEGIVTPAEHVRRVRRTNFPESSC